jgi:hypothetical protein
MRADQTHAFAIRTQRRQCQEALQASRRQFTRLRAIADLLPLNEEARESGAAASRALAKLDEVFATMAALPDRATPYA